MNLLDLFRYLDMARRLAMLFAILRGVRARDPATTAGDYTPAAESLLNESKVQSFIERRLSAEEAAAFRAGLPTFLFALDAITE